MILLSQKIPNNYKPKGTVYPYEEVLPNIKKEETEEIAPQIQDKKQDLVVAPNTMTVPINNIDEQNHPTREPIPLSLPENWQSKIVGDPDKITKPGPGEPENPSSIFEEIIPPQTSLEQKNAIMGVRDKIFSSMTEGIPLLIDYITLSGIPIRRKIEGLYVYYGDTHRHVLVAHDYDVNDFRAFVVDGIKNASLLEQEQGDVHG